jgi:hypothetical protein
MRWVLTTRQQRLHTSTPSYGRWGSMAPPSTRCADAVCGSVAQNIAGRASRSTATERGSVCGGGKLAAATTSKTSEGGQFPVGPVWVVWGGLVF